MADKAVQLKEQGSVRGATGGRSTQQKCTTRGQGSPLGCAELDCGPGDKQPRPLPSKAALGRSACSPCCERKGLQPPRSAWPWDHFSGVGLNGASLGGGGGDGSAGLQERLVARSLLLREEERPGGHGALCCQAKGTADPPSRGAAASPGPWNVPDKLPGTLRSWTSTVSR